MVGSADCGSACHWAAEVPNSIVIAKPFLLPQIISRSPPPGAAREGATHLAKELARALLASVSAENRGRLLGVLLLARFSGNGL